MDATRSTEPQFFERLCWLRGLYEHRGPRDRELALSVDEAVGHAEALLRDPQLLERVLEGVAL